MPSAVFDMVSLRAALLAWYDAEHRRLPWRAGPGESPDPYHVLVSEAMLQQTQVATVVDYFRRFVERWPTVAALADADEQQVLRLWQGLGYYRRARNLHAAARVIVEQHGGRVPSSVQTLLELPGVGRYTAGAIASIAHGVQAPILDGNVARVLARWFVIEQPIDKPATRSRLWTLAEAAVPAGRPGDFNQAMMELGATVCVPRSPLCLTCPVAEWCGARAAGRQDELPAVTPRRKPSVVVHHVVVVARRGRCLFERRPGVGLWSNMWQLPTAEHLPKATPGALSRWVKEHLGLSVASPERDHDFTHQTTHRTIRFVVWRAGAASGRLNHGSARWRKLDQLDDLPLPNPQRRIVAGLLSHASSSPAPRPGRTARR